MEAVLGIGHQLQNNVQYCVNHRRFVIIVSPEANWPFDFEDTGSVSRDFALTIVLYRAAASFALNVGTPVEWRNKRIG